VCGTAQVKNPDPGNDREWAFFLVDLFLARGGTWLTDPHHRMEGRLCICAERASE
jgi:hypothetical protein